MTEDRTADTSSRAGAGGEPESQAAEPATEPDENLIESEPPSGRATEFRRRLDLLVPASVGRKTLGALAAAALALGLLAGLLVGTDLATSGPGRTATGTGAAPEDKSTRIGPEEAVERLVTVYAMGAATLTIEDLAALGESATIEGGRPPAASGLDGLCGIPSAPAPVPPPGERPIPIPSPPGPESLPGSVPYGVSVVYDGVGPSAMAFGLGDAILTQRIGPYLDPLATSAQLRGTVEMARTCASSDGDPDVRTDGVRSGIGDEYAVFTVGRPDLGAGGFETAIVVLVRVGGQLIEISLTPDGGAEVPDGLTRALHIAEAAARLAGG